jgi:TRAP-type C4-dicarboxylate transport system substrate-binding protein
VLSLVRQLPAESKKAALLALAQEAGRRRDERMAYAEAQLRRRARERGFDWDKLTEDEREAFVNRLLHEA